MQIVLRDKFFYRVFRNTEFLNVHRDVAVKIVDT